jgi:hypothetical protein
MMTPRQYLASSITAREKLWALKLPLVNSKPVLHRPVETARLCGKFAFQLMRSTLKLAQTN